MKIEYKNLTLNRGNKLIVDDFSLTINDANICVIVGPSGSGKSTLLEATAGLIPVSKGQIIFDQQDITDIKPSARQIGYVFQDFALYPNMTVAQNIEFGLKVQKLAKDKRQTIVNDVLATVDLTDYANRLPNQLSGGQQQRVAIGRALALGPKVLLMDEPLSSLDASLRQQLRNQIVEIQQKFKKTIIFVTHDQSEALALADQIVVLNEGKIVATGTPFELYNNPPSEFILRFFNSENLNTVDDKYVINQLINQSQDKILIRSADIKLVTGSEFIVQSVTLHGQSQIVNLTGVCNLHVSVSSAQPIIIGDTYNIEVTNYFTF